MGVIYTNNEYEKSRKQNDLNKLQYVLTDVVSLEPKKNRSMPVAKSGTTLFVNTKYIRVE
jgi:hypothetical protein